ncbi:hypothetical protein BGZ83_009103 [Gryganskiella cystojenkinii]|nr:hypothetical protein BGZ83_009103 [Gryganskiella cystojenkinii]
MSAEPDTYGSSSPPIEINAIVPGNIFQDDVPPSTFADSNEPFITNPPPSNAPPSSASGIIGGRAPDIEVNPTIQTILISLGICVGALFLLGVIATQYITHKNKRAEEKKRRLTAESEITLTGGTTEKSGGGGKNNSEKSDMVTVMIDDYDTSSKKPKNLGRSISSSSSSSHTNSPKSSIIGGIGTAVGTNAAARGLGGGGPVGGGVVHSVGGGGGGGGGAGLLHLEDQNLNGRGSFMDVTQVYGRRGSITPSPLPHQSTMTLTSSHSSSSLNAFSSIRSAGPGYSQQHGSELQIGVYPYNQQLQQQFSPFLRDLNSPHFPISPSSAGTTEENRNPFLSPPLSAGLQDPFRTQNNSQVNLSNLSDLGGETSKSNSTSTSTSSTSLASSAALDDGVGPLDRRSIANSTPSPPMAQLSNKFSPALASQGSGHNGQANPTNEGNAWYRKRTSVIIPDATAAHIRLWNGNGEDASNSPLTKSPPRLQRPFRSGSHSSVKGPAGLTASPPMSTSSSSSSPLTVVTGTPNPVTPPSSLPDASQWTPKGVTEGEEEVQEETDRDYGRLEPKASTVSRNGAAVFEGRINKINTSPPRSKSPSGREVDTATTPRTHTPTTPRVPLLIEPERSNDQHDGEEPSEEVIVRLRANRRGSHSSHRQSYLDDIQ